MKQIVKNILAVVAGLFLGGALNMGIIMISSHIIPPPEGADLTTMEGLTSSMHLMLPKHFLMPFLAHALGTWLGAFITGTFATNHKMRLALLIGILFLFGGIMNVYMLPSPMWFTITDLVGAYLPMAYLGGLLATRRK
jgi:hypothetical protein